jgi:hypothetical protein
MYCGCPTFGGIVTEYDSHLHRLSASTGDVRRSADSVDRKCGEKSLYLVPHWALLMYRSPGYLAGKCGVLQVHKPRHQRIAGAASMRRD